ncbi:MAG: hypothetical protein U0R17_04975 [Acidimicrobiia bacterium]
MDFETAKNDPQFPQITYGYQINNENVTTFSGRVPHTKKIDSLRKKIKEQGVSFIPPNAPEPNPDIPVTRELPAVKPDEMPPTHARVSIQNSDGFHLDEIMLMYGVQGFLAANYSFRFTEDGTLDELVYDPLGSSERVVAPGSFEFKIRCSELTTFLNSCIGDRKCFRGCVFEHPNSSGITILNPPNSGEILEKTIQSVSRGFGNTIDR